MQFSSSSLWRMLGTTAFAGMVAAISIARAGDAAAPLRPTLPVPMAAVIPATPLAAEMPVKAARPGKLVPIIHHLAADAHQLRFEGETISRAWPIYVTQSEAASRARVSLAYTNAVSVNPEVSTLTISINDVVVGHEKIMAPGEPSIMDVELPAGLLVSGYNSMRVTVNQRHRVDCSINATYELWTALNGAATGLIFPDVQDTIVEAVDLPGIIADQDGARHIRAVLPRVGSPTQIDRVLRAAQAVALRGGMLLPVVDVGEEMGDAPGVSILAGTITELRSRGFGAFVREDMPVSISAGARPGHTNIVFSGATLAEVDKGIDDFAANAGGEQASGSPSGLALAAILDGAHVPLGSSVSLKQLEAGSLEFTGRLFRAGVDIILPPDFYSADYGKATFRIDAGYSAGLDRDSKIIVRVNGKDASSLALPDPRGDIFRKRPITVSLADLRPGFNHLTIEAELSTASDVACTPTRSDDELKRFVLLENSELVLPRVARIAHLPNLAAIAASGYPYSGTGAGKLFLAKSDPATIAAAGTFLARAALGAGHILETNLVTRVTDIEKSPALIFGAIDDLPPNLIDYMGLDAASLRKGWAAIRNAGKAVPADGKAPRGSSVPAQEATAAIVANAAAPRANRTGDLYDQWSRTMKAEKTSYDPYAAVSTWLEGFFGGTLLHTPFFELESKVFIPAPASRLVVAQQMARGGKETWTLVTGATAETLAKDVSKLIAPTAWHQLDGATAAFDPVTGAVSRGPVSPGYFMATTDWSPANLRLIAAGWFSSNLEYFVLALFLLCCLTGVLTAVVVRYYGVKVA